MEENLQMWLSSISDNYSDIQPDFEWKNQVPDNLPSLTSYFQSFRNFSSFPSSFLPQEILVEGTSYLETKSFYSLAVSLLQNFHSLIFSEISSFVVLCLILSQKPDLLYYIPKEPPIDLFCWCLLQLLPVHVKLVFSLIHQHLLHPVPLHSREDLHAILLLIECSSEFWDFEDIPPITSDEYETIFCLAFSPSRSSVNKLASFILPQILPLISSTRAAHLLFRRILPYCSISNAEGREFAFFNS